MLKTKLKIYFVVTIEMTINVFLLNHLKKLSKIYDLTIILNTKDPFFLRKRGLDPKVIPLNIHRDIRIFSDFFCLIRLIYIFIKHKPNAVHSITPKAGLLAMLASFIALVPVRIHTFTGQVWATQDGFKKYILKCFDQLIARLSTFNIVDSLSQQKFLIGQNILSKNKSIVFGSGSIAGVDLKKFKPNKLLFSKVRNKLLISENALIFIYLGRLTKDKGVLDLAEAFSLMNSKKVYLIFVGPDEGDFVKKITKINSHKLDKLRFVNYTNFPEEYLAASDVLCLPSYREGFGTVIIEAAATNIPAIGSNIYGIADAILDRKSGLIHPPGNIKAILKCMNFFLKNRNKIKAFGKTARNRAINEFDSNQMSNNWLDFYNRKII